MPLYVYGCRTCDVVVEELRPIELADFPPVECPVCHGLCEREVAVFNIASGSRSQSAASSADDPPDAGVNLLHPPGCPCCRRSA
jgi:putative FmdB family regulatory protein